MKNLFPAQSKVADFFEEKLRENKNTLDSSSVGTGKTVVASHLALRLERPVAVMCPKAVIPSWERELKEVGIDPIFVLNFEKVRTGNTPHMSKRGKKIMNWKVPKNTLFLVDEIHKCKGPYTQNAQLIISLVKQNFLVHGMSATACEDPTEMRSIGYMLGLHSLAKSENGLYNWFAWMKSYGCYQDEWNGWRMGSNKTLKKLHDKIYGSVAAKLTILDFPDSFRNNRVFVEPMQFSDSKKIIKIYEKLGLTPQIITDLIENGTVDDSEHVIVNILRARQLTEAMKVPDLVAYAQDLEEQGNSVVLFVNFRDTVEALCKQLNCKAIQGGQTVEERQAIVDEFQNDESTIVVANIAAGGTGLSLHDCNGDRPRVSLICPSFNAKDYLQTLGRIHRNGAKSDAIQKVLVTSGSIEENVIDSIERKINNLTELHGV
tara:strand:+ start:20352 stop:21647 length:1296 start_codon:yes stop_codon:yes gene_type:complete